MSDLAVPDARPDTPRERSRDPSPGTALDRTTRRRERWAWLTAFVLVRAAILLALYAITGGREVASDVDFHIMLIREPFGIIGGFADARISSYAPLQSFVTWPLFTVHSLWAEPFVAFRLMLASVEFATLWLLVDIVQRSVPRASHRHLMLGLFVLAPYQYLTTLVFVQDEIIGQFWLVAAAWCLLVRERRGAALYALALGVLTAKVFLIVPWFFLAAFGGRRGAFGWRAVFGSAALIGGVYATAFVAAVVRDGSLPLVGFVPGAEYSVTLWSLLLERVEGGSETLRRWSLLASLGGQVLLIAWCLARSSLLRHPLAPIALLVAPTALFLATFYQHNSEYPILFAPLALLLWRTAGGVLAAATVLTLAWMPKVLFGLKNVGIVNANTSGTRNELLAGLVSRLGVDFAQLHPLGVALYSALFVALVVALIGRLRPVAEPPSGSARGARAPGQATRA